MTSLMVQAEQFEEHRPHLQAVAYRMLGSIGEAEEAMLRREAARSAPAATSRAWPPPTGRSSRAVCRIAAVLLPCAALAGCGGQHVPDGYMTKGRVACSPRFPPLDVSALVGRRFDDARRIVWNQDCVLRVLYRDGEFLGDDTENVIAPKVDVAVADGRVVGVRPHRDR
jgi:hypothetical protein